jgi:hypothetical protein
MTRATMLIIGSSLFESKSSRRADGESPEAGAAKSMAAETTAPKIVLLRAPSLAIGSLMADQDRLTPADLAAALAFALRYQGRKRVHNAEVIMAGTLCGSTLSARNSLPLIRASLWIARSIAAARYCAHELRISRSDDGM